MKKQLLKKPVTDNSPVYFAQCVEQKRKIGMSEKEAKLKCMGGAKTA